MKTTTPTTQDSPRPPRIHRLPGMPPCMATAVPLDKAGELTALDAFRASLPPDSYLAAWLDYASPHIAQDISADIFPTFRPDECRAAQLAALAEAQKLRDGAKAYAAEVRAAAAEEAGKIVTAARHEAARTAARLNLDLEEATAAARRFIRAAEECERTAPTAPPATQNHNS